LPNQNMMLPPGEHNRKIDIPFLSFSTDLFGRWWRFALFMCLSSAMLCCVYTYSLCLTEFGILLVAVSCPQSRGGKFRVNPGNSLIIQQGHVGFFIAQGPNEVHRLVINYYQDNQWRRGGGEHDPFPKFWAVGKFSGNLHLVGKILVQNA